MAPTTSAPTTAAPSSDPCQLYGAGTPQASTTVTPPAKWSSASCVVVYNAQWVWFDTRRMINGVAYNLQTPNVVIGQTLRVEIYESYSYGYCDRYLGNFQCKTTVGVPINTPAPTLMPAPAPLPQERGLYVWAMDECFFNGYATTTAYKNACGYATFDAYMDAYLTMLQRPWNGTYPGFTRLFSCVPLNHLTNKAANLRQGLRRAHDAGIKVELLHDGSTWVRSATGVQNGLNLCWRVHWFNGNATDPRDRFDGVHLDIEPHTLDTSVWMSNTAGGNDRYNQQWEANLIAILRGCREIFAGTNTTVAWDVPDDYSYYNTDLWDALVADPYVDYLSIMNYYDSLDYIVWGRSEVGGAFNVLNSLQGRVPVLIALETGDPYRAPDEISFWQEGVAPLESALAHLNDAFGTAAGFMGVAVHYDFPYGVLPLNGFGESDELPTSCNSYDRMLYIVVDRGVYRSMKVYQASTNTFLKTYNIGSHGGTFFQPIGAVGAGPYRLEFYDGTNGNKLTPTSAVGMVSCTVMA